MYIIKIGQDWRLSNSALEFGCPNIVEIRRNESRIRNNRNSVIRNNTIAGLFTFLARYSLLSRTFNRTDT